MFHKEHSLPKLSYKFQLRIQGFGYPYYSSMSSIDTVSIFSSTTAADSIDKKKRKPLRHIRYQSKRPKTKSGRLLPGRGPKDPTHTATVCNKAVSRALCEDNSSIGDTISTNSIPSNCPCICEFDFDHQNRLTISALGYKFLSGSESEGNSDTEFDSDLESNSTEESCCSGPPLLIFIPEHVVNPVDAGTVDSTN